VSLSIPRPLRAQHESLVLLRSGGARYGQSYFRLNRHRIIIIKRAHSPLTYFVIFFTRTTTTTSRRQVHGAYTRLSHLLYRAVLSETLARRAQRFGRKTHTHTHTHTGSQLHHNYASVWSEKLSHRRTIPPSSAGEFSFPPAILYNNNNKPSLCVFLLRVSGCTAATTTYGDCARFDTLDFHLFPAPSRYTTHNIRIDDQRGLHTLYCYNAVHIGCKYTPNPRQYLTRISYNKNVVVIRRQYIESLHTRIIIMILCTIRCCGGLPITYHYRHYIIIVYTATTV